MNRLRYICISTKIMRMLKIYTSIMTTSVVTTSGAFTLLLCLAFIFTFYPNPCGIAHATTTLTQADIDSGTVSGDTEYIINTDINYSSSNLSIGTSSTSATLTITDGATFTLYNIPDFVIYDTMNLDNGNLSYTSTTTVLMSLANGLSLTNGSTFTVNGQVLFGGPIMGLGQLSNSTGALSVTEGSTFTLGGGAQYYASDLFVDSSTAYIGDESVGKTSFARSDNTGSGAIIIQNNSQVYWTARTIESYDIYFDTFKLDNNSVFYLGVDTNAGSTILYLDGTMSITNNSRFFAQTSDIQLGKDSTDFNNAMSYITDSYFELGLTGYTSGSLLMSNNHDLTISNSTFILQGGASFESDETSASDTIVKDNSTIILKDNATIAMRTGSDLSLTSSTLTVSDNAGIGYTDSTFTADTSSATFSDNSKTIFNNGIDATSSSFTINDSALLYTRITNFDFTSFPTAITDMDFSADDNYGDMNFSSGSTVTINGGTVYSANDINFDNTSNLIVAGDLFTSPTRYAMYADGSLNVQDGSTLTITGLSGSIADGTQRLYIVNADADGDGKDGSGNAIASTEDTANTWDTVTFTNPYVEGTGQYLVVEHDYVVDYYFISSDEPAVDDLIDDPKLDDNSTYLYNVTHDQDNLHAHLVSSSHMALLGGVYNNIYNIATLASRTISLERSLEEGMWVWALPMAYSEEARSFNLNGVNVGYDSDLLGLSFGADYINHNTSLDRIRLGIASHLGGGNTRTVGDFLGIKNEFDFWGASVYADFRKGNFDLNTEITYFETNNDMRQATASYFDYRMNDLTADVKARMLTFDAEIMYTYNTEKMGDFIPFAGIRYSILEVGKHTIWNGDEEVYHVKRDHEDIMSIPLGLRYKYDKITEAGNLIRPTAYASVVFTNAHTNTQAFLVGTYADSSYTVPGDIEFLDPVYFEAGVGVQWSDKKNWNLGLNYDVQISQHRTSHGLAARVSYTF